MKEPNENRIEVLFEKALILDEKDRLDFLKSKCGDDEELLLEVLSLLEADSDIHPMLNQKASDIINIEDDFNFVGQTVGNYKLVEEIATGGMGTVFLAERNDGVFEQKVALKIIKPGLSTIPIIRRFQQERQILASLHHPNIARLYDGGVTEDRRPYFTMEYVEGIPIDEYCNKEKLNTNERLSLFLKVCEAVQYAHNNLVIHRDLKPSNILINESGNIKLLDFGISKVLSAEEENLILPTITQAEINLLTPEYSSPEQILNNKVSVATDVYSLGLILYKLLTGINAHDFKSRTFNEFEKVICEKEITKPSSIVNYAESSENINLSINHGKLKKLLRGDLDKICLMALRKDPQRRYASVEMLAYDIHRHLNNLPILANKESLTYSTSKFVKRHKTSVIAAVVLFFVVNGLILFYTLQLKKERDKAQIEARKSEQIASFMQNLFLISDPNESLGETITAMELLDRGASELKRSLSDEPEIKSRLLNTIGNVYANLGLYKSAEEAYLEIKDQYTQNKLSNSTYIETLNNLGKLYRLDGKYDQANEIIQTALNESKMIYKEEHPYLGDIYANSAGYFYETGDYEKSRLTYNKALNIFINNYGEKNEKVAAALYNLGVLSFEVRDLKTADSLYRIAIRIETELKGEVNSNVAEYQNQLAQVLRHQQKYEEARLIYEKVLKTRMQLFGDEHPHVAVTLNHLSRLYYNQEQFDNAEPLAREALRIRLKVFDETHPEVSASRSSLAGTLMGKGNYIEAEELFYKAYIASLNKLGEKHPYTPALLGNVGWALLEQSKFDFAEKYIIQSIEMLTKIFNEPNRYRSKRILWLSDIYNKTNRYAESEKLLKDHLNEIKGKPSDEHWFKYVAESQLAYSLFKQNKTIEAEGLLVHSYNSLKKNKGSEHSETQKAIDRILEYYKTNGRQDKVKEYSKLI